VQAWKKVPEHREAQRLGREFFYTEYRIQVCDPHRTSRMPEIAMNKE